VQEEDAFKCYCGSEICRGTMAPKKKDKNNLSDAQKLKLIRSVRKQ
jgi:hypothetical protein